MMASDWHPAKILTNKGDRRYRASQHQLVAPAHLIRRSQVGFKSRSSQFTFVQPQFPIFHITNSVTKVTLECDPSAEEPTLVPRGALGTGTNYVSLWSNAHQLPITAIFNFDFMTISGYATVHKLLYLKSYSHLLYFFQQYFTLTTKCACPGMCQEKSTLPTNTSDGNHYDEHEIHNDDDGSNPQEGHTFGEESKQHVRKCYEKRPTDGSWRVTYKKVSTKSKEMR